MFLKYTVLLLCIHISFFSAFQISDVNTENNSNSSNVARYRRNAILDKNEKCGGTPLKENGRSMCTSPDTCFTKCDNGYQFPNGKDEMELVCDENEWKLQGLGRLEKVECEPICNPKCENGGNCIAPNVCLCTGNKYGGVHCELEKCNSVPNIQYSNPNCTVTSCNITCNHGYQFVDGSKVIQINCEKGKFNLAPNQPHLNNTIPPACQPICDTPCENCGVCIKPNICSCPKTHEGNNCEYEKGCKEQPITENATPDCQLEKCKVTCDKNFALSDGSKSIDLTCMQRVWSPVQSISCTPFCPTPCQNGGQCTEPNKCTCQSEYEGNHCEFKKGCITEPTSHNSTLNCDTENCDISCNSGYAFPDGTTEMKMICDQRKWKSVQSNQPFTPNCKPICVPICENHGRCIEPNKCSCTKKYEGSQCEFEKGCKTKPIPENATPNCSTDKCEITCDVGYKFPDGSTKMNMMCEQRQWKSVFEPICTPVCSTPCQNEGQCTKPNKCTCQSEYEGNHCEFKKGCITEPTSHNATLNCDTVNCDISCNFGYAFSDGSTEMKMICEQRKWKSVQLNKHSTPSCQPVCVPICENNGQCIEPNECSCPKKYEGSQCEFEKGCKTNPTTENAKPNCNTDTCEITCNTGYEFPDGSIKMDLKCEERRWIPYLKQNFEPNCKPICDPPCRNGGTCCKPNDCSCLHGFDGLFCERKVCIAQPPAQDADVTCNKFECKIICHKGYIYPDGTDHMQMNCKNGKWESAFPKKNISPDCQLNCDAGLDYNRCGPKIERTCDNAEDKSVCVAGCFCPNGMVKHEGKCVRLEECPCTSDEGIIFKPGSETMTIDEASLISTTCKCENGQINCKSQTFTRKRCTVTGDPHFRTFDEINYDFQGNGSYRLLGTDNIEINSYFADCGGSYTCVESLKMKVSHGNKNVTVVLRQNLQVEINGHQIQTFPINVLTDYMRISLPSSTKLSVDFKDGWRVFWDGRINVDIDTISLYNGKIEGFCDLTSSNKRNKRSIDKKSLVALAAKLACIGDSCKDVEKGLNVPHPCDTKIETKKRAEDLCARLKNDNFKACHTKFDLQPYYDNCVFDVCACNHDINSCMCNIFTSYANECSRQGAVITNWRKSIQECAIKCPNGQIYEECSTSCYRSCNDMHLARKNCSRDCIDGCRCPEGQALDESNKCIAIDSCPSEYKINTFDCAPINNQIRSKEMCTCVGTEWKCPKPAESCFGTNSIILLSSIVFFFILAFLFYIFHVCLVKV